jgi:hypothetical protein
LSTFFLFVRFFWGGSVFAEVLKPHRRFFAAVATCFRASRYKKNWDFTGKIASDTIEYLPFSRTSPLWLLLSQRKEFDHQIKS